MKRKMLAAALITAVAATGASVMNASATYELDEVTVTADREGVVRTLPGGLSILPLSWGFWAIRALWKFRTPK